jgi:hypothetical protein
VLTCIALAALSLIGPHSPTYDPWAWLVWGREITHLDLVTTTGPSWKPLPVMFTTPFSLLGDSAAPVVWLLVARAGGLLAIAMAYRLAARIAGAGAGVVAALGLVLANHFVDTCAHGNSEGLLVAFSLLAIERHLDGRRRDAFLFGLVVALLRPESWPFVGLYGLWLVAGDWRRPERRRTLALLAGGGLLVAVLWFVPEYAGSGNLLRGASRAQEPVAGSPAQAAHPFLAVFDNSSSALSLPIYAGAVLAVVFALDTYRRTRRVTVTLALATIATVLMVIVGVLAQIGFTGNLRYVTLPAAILCVVGGVGWAQLVAGTRRRWGGGAAAALAGVAVAASIPFVVGDGDRLGHNLGKVRDDARLSDGLDDVIERAGGRRVVDRCLPVWTRPLLVTQMAWELHIHTTHVGIHARPPGTVILPRKYGRVPNPPFALRAATPLWTLASTCR